MGGSESKDLQKNDQEMPEDAASENKASEDKSLKKPEAPNSTNAQSQSSARVLKFEEEIIEPVDLVDNLGKLKISQPNSRAVPAPESRDYPQKSFKHSEGSLSHNPYQKLERSEADPSSITQQKPNHAATSQAQLSELTSKNNQAFSETVNILGDEGSTSSEKNNLKNNSHLGKADIARPISAPLHAEDPNASTSQPETLPTNIPYSPSETNDETVSTIAHQSNYEKFMTFIANFQCPSSDMCDLNYTFTSAPPKEAQPYTQKRKVKSPIEPF